MIKPSTIKPTIMIGKSGITPSIVWQVIQKLKKDKIIRVKFLPSAIQNNKKELFNELAEKTHSKLIHKVGFVVTLRKFIS